MENPIHKSGDHVAPSDLGVPRDQRDGLHNLQIVSLEVSSRIFRRQRNSEGYFPLEKEATIRRYSLSEF